MSPILLVNTVNTGAGFLLIYHSFSDTAKAQPAQILEKKQCSKIKLYKTYFSHVLRVTSTKDKLDLGWPFWPFQAKIPLSQSWPCAGPLHTVKPTTPSLYAPQEPGKVISTCSPSLPEKCTIKCSHGRSLSAFSKHAWRCPHFSFWLKLPRKSFVSFRLHMFIYIHATHMLHPRHCFFQMFSMCFPTARS